LFTPTHTTFRKTAVVRASEKADLSGEWPVNWSLASYEDVGEFFQKSLFKDTAAPGTLLTDVMSTALTVTYPDVTLDAAKKLFSEVSGVPVVKSSNDYTLVGVLSKKDLSKSGKTVSELMSTPPIAARPDNKVADAACLMLKHKIHRIPVVNNEAKLVGLVTRTDIFSALESSGNVDVKVSL
jgi:CBS domain-containing protein